MTEPSPAGRGLDLPVLLIAVVFATTAVVWCGGRVAVARCREAGGELRVSGMDQVCERADRSPVVMGPVWTDTVRGAGAGLWLVLVAGSYGGMRSYIRGRK